MTETAAPACYRHPERPTRLRCTECDRPICVDCSNDAAVGQKCPECSRATGRHRVVDARRTTGAQAGLTGAPVSAVILAATIIIYVIGFGSRSNEIRLVDDFALFGPLVDQGEVWRLLTHAFLHGSTMHIAFNMYALYLFGPALERRVGSLSFGLFYAATAVGGAALFVALREVGVAVGASGAIFGLLGAWIFGGWKARHTPAGRAQFNQLVVLLGINLALPLFVPNIAWEGHLGGLLTGVAIAALWATRAGSGSSARDRALIAGAVLVVAFAVGVLV